jgi:hypothetical protein
MRPCAIAAPNAKLRNQERRANVNGKHLVPLFDGYLFEIRRLNTRIVDQQVDLSEYFRTFDVSALSGWRGHSSHTLNAGGFDLFYVSPLHWRKSGK